jgi:hypothetical protein
MLYLPKNKLHWNQKTKYNVILNVGNVQSVTQFDGYRPNYRHLTPKVDRNGFCPARFLCQGNGSPDEILSICLKQENLKIYPKFILAICLKQENLKIYPKLILASFVRTRCQVVFDNKHSLHLWKRHPCTWLLKDNWLTDASILQHDVTSVGSCIVTAILCLLIQSKCIELQPWINILAWVAWLFDHSV